MPGTAKLSCSPRFERLSCRANITSLLMTLRSATYAYAMKRPSRKRKMRCNWMFDEEYHVKREFHNSMIHQYYYYYLIDKSYVIKDLGDH